MEKTGFRQSAIIGGSGLYQMEQLRDATEQKIETPFGLPSDALIGGKPQRTPGLLFYHDTARGHRILPARTESSCEYLRAALTQCALDHCRHRPSVVCRKNTSPATFCCRRNSTTRTSLRGPTTRFFGEGNCRPTVSFWRTD